MKKVILYLSVYRENAKTFSYTCPEGLCVEGTQTNDAPVRYLLRAYPDVSEILCVVTQEAEPAWEAFCQMVCAEAPKVRLTKLFLGSAGEFISGPMAGIVERVGKDDEILLEITGGLRDAVIHLVLVSRALSYIGVKTVGAVYSNLNTRRIIDVLPTYRLFDLVSGLQELSSFGSPATLRKYYADDCEPAVAELLESMDDLKSAIALCRTKQLKPKLDRFNAAMGAAVTCTDPLLRALLPAFQKKFGKKLTTPGTIKWCVDSDMMQQALTIYTERIPAYLFGHGQNGQKGMLEAPQEGGKTPTKSYEDTDAVLFYKDFMQIAALDPAVSAPAVALKRYAQEHAAEIVQYANGGRFTAPGKLAVGVRNLALICRIAYFENGGVFDFLWVNKLPPEKNALRGLAERLNNKPAQNVYRMLNGITTYPSHLVNLLLELEQVEEADSLTEVSIETVENLEQLLPQSGYRLNCSVAQMQMVMRDYLYIKALRNLASHANDEGTAEQTLLMDYLVSFGYVPLEQTTAGDVKHALLQALEHLRQGSKEQRI